MELSDEFVVPLSVEKAWALLTDLERVAPCLPGAQLDEVEGDEYRGRVRVKVGPMTVEYKGVARFTSRDEAAGVAELLAEGRETRGQGQASATVRATLSASDTDSTRVVVETNLDVSGRVAQFGRGVIADVSSRLLGQFVKNLERDLLAGGDASAGAPTATATPAEPEPAASTDTTSETRSDPTVTTTTERVVEQPPASIAPVRAEAKPVGAFALLGPVLLKRLSPLAIIGAVVAVISRRRRRRRS